MVVVLLVASVFLCSVSLMSPPWLNRTETRWLLALQFALLLLSITSPNPWVGFAVAWIAIHPWIAYVAYNNNLIPFAPIRNSVYEPLFPVLWWSVMYSVASQHYRKGDWVFIAYAIIVWAFINLMAATYQRYASLPKWWIDSRSSEFPNAGGLVGGSYGLSLITALGSLSASVIYFNNSSLILAGIAILLLLASWFTGTRSSAISIIAVLILFAVTKVSVWYSLVLLLAPVAMIHIGENTHGKYLIPPWRLSNVLDRYNCWKPAIIVSIRTYFIGVGLGMWSAITAKPDDYLKDDIQWRNLHNDWLQSVVELGPVPALCAVGLLVSQWTTLTLSISPDRLFGLLLITTFSMYAIVYFPMRDHMPSMMVAISLGILNTNV